VTLSSVLILRQWKAAAAENARERSLPSTLREAAISEEPSTGSDDHNHAPDQVVTQTDAQMQEAKDLNTHTSTGHQHAQSEDADATSSHPHGHGIGVGHHDASGHTAASGQSGEGSRVAAGDEKFVVPKLWGGGLAQDKGDTGSVAGRRTGGFSFEYKLMSGRQFPAGALSSDFSSAEAPAAGRLSSPTARLRPSSATTERGRPPTAETLRRPMTARPVGMVHNDGRSDEPAVSRVIFPAAKKKRPLSASIVRREELAITRIGAGAGALAGGGGGAAAAPTRGGGGLVPAPPTASSPFISNQAPAPGIHPFLPDIWHDKGTPTYRL
jgi:hypothetical protein